jgi:predicted nucleic acid-binding protein
MVIVDTNVWLDFFRDASSATGESLDRLIKAGEAALVGVVLAELARGARDEDQRRSLHRSLGGVPYLEISRSAWLRAGRIAEDLDRRGIPIPLPDIFIAATAIEGGHQVLTRDTKHFERISGLKLYQMEGEAHD